MLKPYVVPPIDAAIVQLDWAMRLVVEHQAYIPAITLSGAAEGMLERCLQSTGATATAHATLKSSLVEKGYGSSDDIGKIMNGPRNFLKHLDLSAFDTDAADLQSMAIAQILQACIDLYRLDSSVCSEFDQFYSWVQHNRPDLS
ncbi:MAG: hypothetical protein ABL907_00580 [Hyphomicrobium sp.]